MHSGLPITTLGFLLVVASIVAVVTSRLKLPYSVGLVAAGMVLAFLPISVDIHLTPDLIFDVLLPPLIFEAAVQIPWPPFRRDLPVSLTLAFVGVAISAVIVTTGVHLLCGWGWSAAILFGILIGATDPVSVIAAFKELRVEPRLALLVEGESLLNDGAAAVGFSIAVAVAVGGAISPVIVGGLALWTVFGGVAVGAGVAGAMLLMAGRTSDHLVEITLTVVVAYGSFLVAESVHASGVLATLTAGLVVGNVGWRGPVSKSSRTLVLAFWDYAAFLANSIVFILIGLQVSEFAGALFSITSLVVIMLVLVGRSTAVYGLCALFRRGRLAVDMRHQHVLVWGGLRGALALALALSLPYSIPERGAIIVAAFAVVAFSIFVQGLTMRPMIKRLGLLRADADQDPSH